MVGIFAWCQCDDPMADAEPTPCEEPQELKLLYKARADEAALAQLLELYRGYLWAIAKQEVGPQLAAKIPPSDVVQDVIVKAYAQFTTFNSDTIDEFLAWLRTILANRLSDLRSRYLDTQMRQLKREVSIQDLDSQDFLTHLAADENQNPVELAAKMDDKSRIEDAIERLPPHYRAVIQLRSFEGFSFSHIAGHFRIEENAARALWQRALAKLRKLLGPVYDKLETPRS